MHAHWLLTAADAGEPLQKAVFWAVQKSAAASTGRPMAVLHGAALNDAVLAWLGRGTLANSGAGRAGGQVVLDAVKHVPVALVGGLVAAAAGLSVRAEAGAFAKAVDGQIARVGAARERLEALGVLLGHLNSRGVSALDTLEAQVRDHELAEAFAAVAAVGEVLSTSVSTLRLVNSPSRQQIF